MRFLKTLSPLWYTVQAILGTLLEQAALLALGVWALPLIDVHISWWLLILIMLANLAYSIFTYVMGMRALRKLPSGGTAGIIGCDGVVVTPLMPTGYVKVRGELWKASSNAPLVTGEEIVVTAVDGLTITVMPKLTQTSQQQNLQK